MCSLSAYLGTNSAERVYSSLIPMIDDQSCQARSIELKITNCAAPPWPSTKKKPFSYQAGAFTALICEEEEKIDPDQKPRVRNVISDHRARWITRWIAGCESQPAGAVNVP
jgi:hypothetical protein